jgi:hypothetical protein
MSEKTKGAAGPHPLALEVGKLVEVGLVFRPDQNSEWRPAPDYTPWTGEIKEIPKESAINGNVNVMPEEGRGGYGFDTIHPLICDLSPRPIRDGSAIEVRHSIRPLIVELGDVAINSGE